MKAAANFKIEGEIPISNDLKYKFWAKGIDGYDLPEAEVSLAQATAYPVKSTTEAFDSIKFYAGDKIFKFEWFMQRAKEGSLETKITETKNDIYVIKTNPATLLRQETLYHIACKHLHGNKGTNEQEMVDRIYSEFQTVAVKNRAGEPLYYWGDGYETPEHFYTTCLLKEEKDNAGNKKKQNGRCGAWADFFVNCVKIHKVINISDFGVVPSTDYDVGLLVKNYSTKGIAPFKFNPSDIAAEKNAVYSTNGIAGQNNSDPISSFGDHALVRYNNIIYDPSYGTGPFKPLSIIRSDNSALNDWENASLWGFSCRIPPYKDYFGRENKKNVIEVK